MKEEMKEALLKRLEKVKEELENYKILEQEASDRYERAKILVEETKLRINHLENQILNQKK